MNQVTNNLENLCREQNISSGDIENLKKYIGFILHYLPENCPTRQEAFLYEGNNYYVLSFPVLDLFENQMKESYIKLSAAIKLASSVFHLTVRYQDQGSFSGLTLRFKL